MNIAALTDPYVEEQKADQCLQGVGPQVENDKAAMTSDSQLVDDAQTDLNLVEISSSSSPSAEENSDSDGSEEAGLSFCDDVDASLVPLKPFRRTLLQAIRQVKVPAFCVGGPLPRVVPVGLTIAGVGFISLPLTPLQAHQIKAASEQAPFGRGPNTIVDISVRNCRQIDASQITLSEEWTQVIRKLANDAAETLGVSDTVTANLYKLILYEEGGFFKAHKDTEKEPGMFATLVVQLPAKHMSGVLNVRHYGEQKRFDFSSFSGSGYFYSTFYTDCEHELLPVRGGNRLVLIYNLVRQPNSPVACPENVGPVDKMIAAASAWSQDAGAPTKLAVLLHHQYTMENLSFGLLKGRDEAIVEALQDSGVYDLSLALVEKKKTGSADENDYNDDPYAEPDDDEDQDDCSSSEKADSDAGYHDASGTHKMIDLLSTSFTVKEWIGEDNKPVSLGTLTLDFERDMIDGRDPFESCAVPDDEEYEVTGNEGATVDYFYHCVVLVLWPRSKKRQLMCLADFDGAANSLLHEVRYGKLDDAKNTLDVIIRCARESVENATKWLPDLLNAACSLGNKTAVKVLLGLVGDTPRSSGHSLHNWFVRGWSSNLGPKFNWNKLIEGLFRAINLEGWQTVETEVIRAIEATSIEHVNHFARLAMKLFISSCKPLQVAADSVAAAVLSVALEQGLRNSSAPAIVAMSLLLPLCKESQADILRKASGISTEALSFAVQVTYKHFIQSTFPAYALTALHKLVETYLAKLSMRTEAGPTHLYTADDAADPARVFVALLDARTRNEELLDKFIRTLLAKGSHKQLSTLLHTPEVIEAVGDIYVSRLALARAAQLQYPKPIPSNRQLEANIAGHPAVTSFLQSDQLSYDYKAFTSIKDARRFVDTHFFNIANLYSDRHCKKYSATAQAFGRGRDSGVSLRKTKDYYNGKVKQWELDQMELSKIQALIVKAASGTLPSGKRRKFNEQHSTGAETMTDCVHRAVVDLTHD